MREILVQLLFVGGHRQELMLREDAPELAELFKVLVNRGTSGTGAEQFFQLPANAGRTACSFSSQQLVAVLTNPPVVVQLEQPPEPAVEQNRETPEPDSPALAAAESVIIQPPKYLVIDDFLSPDENRDMLAYALKEQDRFQVGTVIGHEKSPSPHRSNLVILDFQHEAHSLLLQNRLLVWLPYLLQGLGMEWFPLESVESQLTASNHGQYYHIHQDGCSENDGTETRRLTCIYYFFSKPKPFTGGDLRLYDWRQQDDSLTAANSFQRIEPVSNRLVVFPSTSFHEILPVRCPSKKFADSRFAITTWIRHAKQPDPSATFGWGHFRCGTVPDNFASP